MTRAASASPQTASLTGAMADLEAIWSSQAKVRLGDVLRRQAAKYAVLRSEIAGLAGAADRDGFAWLLHLPDGDALTIRDLALSEEERAHIDNGVRMTAYNSIVSAAAGSEIPALLAMTNEFRAMLGLPVLRFDRRLHEASRIHAAWMKEHGVLSPRGSVKVQEEVWDRTRAAGFTTVPVGENYFKARSVDEVRNCCRREEALLNALLDPRWTVLGAARAGEYWATTFGIGASGSATVSAAELEDALEASGIATAQAPPSIRKRQK